MAHTFKKKLKTLQKILNQSAKYSKVFKKMTCRIDGKNIIIEKELRSEVYDYPNTQKIPAKDIDKNIILERSKLHNMRTRLKDIDSAIEEIEFIDKLKDITK
jgi:hypothetical protein